jgi:tight adherence protein C
MTLLLASLTFMIVVGMVLSGYYLLATESEATQRLRAMVPHLVAAQKPAKKKGVRMPLISTLLATVGRYGLGSDDGTLGQALSVAGLRGRGGATLFVGARTLLSVGPAIAVLMMNVWNDRPLGRAVLLAVLVFLSMHVVVNYWLKRRGRKRMRAIIIALPDSLDLMVVCLEAGLGLNATIARVGEERSAMKDALGEEFALVALELREGRSREDSLRALGERNGVEDLKSLSALIIQSDRLGASMAKTLRSHADVLRTKRRQRAEEAARKLPIKMLFPLALLILPPLFVMTTGPAMLKLKDLAGFLSHKKSR